MSQVPSLDSFGEIYRGFSRDRLILKLRLRNPERVWRRAYEVMSCTPELYQLDEKAIARETMRVLLDMLPPPGK